MTINYESMYDLRNLAQKQPQMPFNYDNYEELYKLAKHYDTANDYVDTHSKIVEASKKFEKTSSPVEQQQQSETICRLTENKDQLGFNTIYSDEALAQSIVYYSQATPTSTKEVYEELILPFLKSEEMQMLLAKHHRRF